MKILALTLSIAAMAPVRAAAQQPGPPASPPVIVTTGEGIVKHAPDRVWVTIGAENRARTPQDAQQANAEAMNGVIARNKEKGIPADAIRTTGFVLQPEFDFQNGKQTLRDYVARNQVQIRVDAIDKAGDVIAAAVATGATNVSSVQFDLKDREAAEHQALRLAVQDARQRADAAAAGAGVQIDRVLRIEEMREGVIPQPRPMAMAMPRAGVTADATVPLEAGDVELRAHVTMTVSIR
ncbi:MAG TPA: SIMPL domain-containing protein [Vicinamibacterales bacterium]